MSNEQAGPIGLEAVLEAARDIIASRSSTYRARSGRVMGIQDDAGEMMWIVPSEEMAALEASLCSAKTRGSEVRSNLYERFDEAFERVEQRIANYRDSVPEEGWDDGDDESWRSWFYAAFEMLREEVADLRQNLPPLESGGQDDSAAIMQEAWDEMDRMDAALPPADSTS